MNDEWKTTDLCDAGGDQVAVLAPLLRSFGGRSRFCGEIRTVRCFEDNSLVRARLSDPGGGAVLVVDGGGSTRCALLGDQLAALAVRNGWSGVVVFGCVRDCAELAAAPLGVLALAPHPRRSEKRGAGERDVAVEFGGVTLRPGAYLYADVDGVVIAPSRL